MVFTTQIYNYLLQRIGTATSTATAGASTPFKQQIFTNVSSSTITVTNTDFNKNKGFFWVRGGLVVTETIDYSLDSTKKILTITVPFVATDGGSMTGETWVLNYQP